MNNRNIQIGIDLGTTNSEAVVNDKNEFRVVKNIFGDEYTPSVFGFDRSKNKVVGKKAYENLYRDASQDEFDNNFPEVKRLMGTSEKVNFPRAGVDMNAEEIASEILKSLREDILRSYPDYEADAAVITVPASFSIIQSEATKRAGVLAGFEHVVLLQEPIAAAVSYGFMNAKDENWLVYDLGGGTFDVALISSKGGSLSVLGHSGDNFLGGKNIDRAIVDEILVPQLTSKYSIKNFSRSNETHKTTFAKLKYYAEQAKIQLSQAGSTTIDAARLCKDDSGEDVYLSIDITRGQLEELIEPLVRDTLELSKKCIDESGLKRSSVNKVILVGGPTQIPYIRENIKKALKVDIETSVDPMTVVAKGACIYAAGQKVPKDTLDKRSVQKKKGACSIELYYDSLTSDSETSVSGKISGAKKNTEYHIQIQSESGTYNSPKTKLNEEGGFVLDSIKLDQNKANIFWVYLFDKQGNSVPLDQDSFTITHGVTVSGAPLPHSVGIVLASVDGVNSEYEVFFPKGAILPLRQTGSFKTVRRFEKKINSNPMNIIVAEGESEIPDRNVFVCEIGIKGSELPHDLPEGTEVDVTLEINESRELSVEVYIPIVDKMFNARATVMDEIIDVSALEEELGAQRERAIKVKANCSDSEKENLDNRIARIAASIQGANTEEDDKRSANKQLKELKNELDKLEESKEMPQLTQEFKEISENAGKLINEYADEENRDENNKMLDEMIKEGEVAIEREDKTILGRINQQIRDLSMRALFSNPATWVYQFEKITAGKHSFTNEQEARFYTEKGKKAIETGNIDELKRCVHSLMMLLPVEDQEAIQKSVSGITRK